MILHFLSLFLLICGVLSQCTFTVLSNDHAQGPGATGKYFNYDNDVVDEILGRQNWHGETFKVRIVNTGEERTVIMWRSANGGSTGSGHGRKTSGAQSGDWDVDDVLEFVDIPCTQCALTVLSKDHAQGPGVEGKYFNYDNDVVDRILGREDWHGETFTVYVVNSGEERTVIMWRSANGGSIGSGHGRKEPISGAQSGDWDVDDVLKFVDIPCHCTGVGFTFSLPHNCECGATCDGEFCNSIDEVKAVLGGVDDGYCETGQCCCSCSNCAPYFTGYPQV